MEEGGPSQQSKTPTPMLKEVRALAELTVNAKESSNRGDFKLAKSLYSRCIPLAEGALADSILTADVVAKYYEEMANIKFELKDYPGSRRDILKALKNLSQKANAYVLASKCAMNLDKSKSISDYLNEADDFLKKAELVAADESESKNISNQKALISEKRSERKRAYENAEKAQSELLKLMSDELAKKQDKAVQQGKGKRNNIKAAQVPALAGKASAASAEGIAMKAAKEPAGKASAFLVVDAEKTVTKESQRKR